MYSMDWNIVFVNPAGKKYQLQKLISVEITKTVENLTDTCVIDLPEAYLNKVLSIDSKIPRGTSVTVQLGYNGSLKTEFVGYVTELTTNNSNLQVRCEDALFVFRKQVRNEVLKPTSVSQIATSLVQQIEPEFTVSCDYDLGYEKFTIHQATAFDVLRKLQEETKADIYFDTAAKVLHIHAPFLAKGGEVKYSPQRNIESMSLEYKRAIDRKFEITVQSIGSDGKVKEVKSGVTGGDSVTIKTGSMSEADMAKVADSELSKRSADRLEGSFDTWLIPYVEPTYTAIFSDADYPEKDGRYYTSSVKTVFNDGGAIRTIQLGIKL